MSDHLDNCRHCGGSAMWNPKEVATGKYDDDYGFIDCTACGIRTEGRTLKAVAIAAWNRRTPLTASSKAPEGVAGEAAAWTKRPLSGGLSGAQKVWLYDHPNYRLAGPPRDVKFDEWGNLYEDGTYEKMSGGTGLGSIIDLSRKPVAVAIYAASLSVPEGWVPCSPAWLEAGGDCANAPRVWVEAEHNHYHPPVVPEGYNRKLVKRLGRAGDFLVGVQVAGMGNSAEWQERVTDAIAVAREAATALDRTSDSERGYHGPTPEGDEDARVIVALRAFNGVTGAEDFYLVGADRLLPFGKAMQDAMAAALNTLAASPASPAQEPDWIEWNGDKRPVAAHETVEVRYWADGVVVTHTGAAGEYQWRVNNKDPDADGAEKDGDIIAYRVIAATPPRAERETDAGGEGAFHVPD